MASCYCGRPAHVRTLGGRTAEPRCAVCRYQRRCENAEASRIERTFKREQQRQRLERRAA